LREGDKEYQRRNAQPLLVIAQQPFQLKRPTTVYKEWAWPGEIPEAVVFDPVATVSATYGVAFQTRFRGNQGPLSSRPAIFIVDPEGVLRYADSQPKDIREDEIFPVLDEFERQRKLISALWTSDATRREAVRMALAPLSAESKTAVPVFAKALTEDAAEVRAGAAAALYWMAPVAEAAIPALQEALQDRDRRVRWLSVAALGRMGPRAPTAVPALVRALKDDNPGVRNAAKEALNKISPAAANTKGR
jgi:hypothetical protein